MPHDQALCAEVKGWLLKAAEDLRAAQHGFTATPPFLGVVAFHCQQAVEKSLKGFLAWKQIPFRKTHSLEEIGEQCLRLDATLKAAIDRAVPLTEYAWRFRYPSEPAEPPHQEVEEAYAVACEVHQAILARLPLEARP